MNVRFPHRQQMWRRCSYRGSSICFDLYKFSRLIDIPVEEHDDLTKNNLAICSDTFDFIADLQFTKALDLSAFSFHATVARKTAAWVRGLWRIYRKREKTRVKYEFQLQQQVNPEPCLVWAMIFTQEKSNFLYIRLSLSFLVFSLEAGSHELVKKSNSNNADDADKQVEENNDRNM